MDPDDVTAVELAAAYAERWEYEISLREIETQMLEPGGGLRSKSPELLRQELWALLLAHFAIRALMAEAAASAGLDPDRLSFMRSIQPRPPPGNRPGGVFPPEDSNEPRKQRSRRSWNESVKAAGSGPTWASSRSTQGAASR